MPGYKFSVGKIILKQAGIVKKEILPISDIGINYEISSRRELDDQGRPIDEFKEEEHLTIEVSYAADAFDTTLIEGDTYDVILETSPEGGGITATIANCKLTRYSLQLSQSEFAITSLTFSKIGRLTAPPGEVPTKQTVTFGGVSIGDSAFVVPSFSGNVQSLIMPTALGTLIQSTQDLGGGEFAISVRGYVKKDTRIELEQYLLNLYQTLSQSEATLQVTYGASSYSIPNCYFVSGSPDVGQKNFTDFTLEFKKSL